ncbi:chromosome segregation protein SMC [Holdemanella biformis]|uniref:Chromosome partition protein Smc n=1 Tax=Holdemanella biformis TaxID=1735 RepID=A0A395WA47_9FIRM|nr:chromosome segregation protein SMC [Holdemanella biformis]MCC3355165.1 chromosome segregation protein SMC [Holdemanella biformis]RGU71777.1 chromosome segregation protein SMC [Holdemanella biformis]RGU92685.1 chromosome segregation protein SMC [Holdemanella biformis]
MFLKRIELQGFKSFADKTVIQFDQDITGIVGPNGCGKSNVNDAIRWVLGEQSVKSLRSGTNMSDIIFSGSEYRKPVNMARVTLVFDNSTRVFDSDFDEIEITRQILRANNEASYFINKTPCRLKDINDLVMDTGLGKDSLSIITQGNISSFADAKPEDRRSLFEEAAGVAKYKKRKKISLSKLEQTKENLDRLQDILDELERQIGPLEKQAKKAEKYISLREKLSKIEISVLVEDIDQYNEKINQINKELFDIQAMHTSENAELLKQETRLESIRKEMYALDKQINELQGKYTNAMEENYQLERRKIEQDEKRKYMLKVADKKARQKEIQAMLEEARFEYQDRHQRLMQTQQDLNNRRNIVNDLKTKISKARYESDQANNILTQLQNRRQVLENMMKQPFAHQQGVRSVMQAKNSLSGVYGVVSELLIAHADKALAVNAALGGSIYQIITKNEADARNAISFLKRNRSGRATFLPLSVCHPRKMNEQVITIASTSPGFLGFASECVDCKEIFDPVKERLLGNVIVVDTLQNANETAKRLRYAYKIVTLDGDIVHTGGSMTGGVTKNQSTPVTMRQELDTINSKIEGQKIKADSCLNETDILTQKLQKENDAIVTLQIELAKLENIYATKKAKYDSILAEYQELGVDIEENAELAQDDLVVQMSKMHAVLDSLSLEIQSLRQSRFDKGNDAEQLENQIRLVRREMNSKQSQIHNYEMEIVKVKTQLENALNRLSTDYEMTYEYALTKKEDVEIESAKEEVIQLRQAISRLGNVNLDAPNEYKEVKERFDFMTSQKEDLEKASQQILAAIDEMDQTMISQFTDMFNKINAELDGVFKAMFGGGRASLSMVDPDDVLNTGIDIDVQPPGKMVKNIQTFSGGEKALIAISVLFAILKARTMPLCIFDEVEAALDQANVERFARYLSHYRGQSQFIAVTHRPGTMEQCDTLYGVTMQKDGVSKVLKVQLKDAVHIAKEEE